MFAHPEAAARSRGDEKAGHPRSDARDQPTDRPTDRSPRHTANPPPTPYFPPPRDGSALALSSRTSARTTYVTHVARVTVPALNPGNELRWGTYPCLVSSIAAANRTAADRSPFSAYSISDSLRARERPGLFPVSLALLVPTPSPLSLSPSLVPALS